MYITFSNLFTRHHNCSLYFTKLIIQGKQLLELITYRKKSIQFIITINYYIIIRLKIFRVAPSVPNHFTYT